MTPLLAVGAAHWDLIGRAALPLAPGDDAPGRVVRRPGGVALNVARASAALGRPAVLLAAVGRDVEGDALLAAAAAAGVATAHVLRGPPPSDAYVALEGPDGALLGAVAACAGLDRAGAALLAPLRAGALAGPGRPWTGRAVLDGNLPAPVLAAALALPGLAGAAVAVVPASPAKAARLAGLAPPPGATLCLNRREAEALVGRPLPDAPAAAAALVARGWAEALVTDGAAPAAHAGPSGACAAAPPSAATRSLTGAGDALVAAWLAARDAGADPAAALDRALAAAVRHVTAEDP